MTATPTPLVYVLYSGDLYGTERMALATCTALLDGGDFAPRLLAPAGPLAEAAAARGVPLRTFRGIGGLLAAVSKELAQTSTAVFLSTRLEQAVALALVNTWHRRQVVHRLVVHGGGGKNVYRRNRWLWPLGTEFIAVSDYVRGCLRDNGIDGRRIAVATDFLPQEAAHTLPRRPPGGALKKVVLVSRLEPYKQVALLFDALDAEPRLAALRFDIYGSGSEAGRLRERARCHAGVSLLGFAPDVTQRLHGYDLLLHTAPEEPFGLVVLEAMAADVPVLVADRGGPAEIVASGGGRTYRAGRADDLARALLELAAGGDAYLQRQAEGGRAVLGARYSQAVGASHYRQLLLDALLALPTASRGG